MQYLSLNVVVVICPGFLTFISYNLFPCRIRFGTIPPMRIISPKTYEIIKSNYKKINLKP
jgi:hypothetical protein